MKRITATVAGVVLAIPALLAVAPSASAATTAETYVAKSGGRTHCLFVGSTGGSREVWYSVQSRSSGKILKWEGPKGSGWRNGRELRPVWIDDKFGGYPDVRPGAKTRLKLTGAGKVRVVTYQKHGRATVTSPKMRSVGRSGWINANCPMD